MVNDDLDRATAELVELVKQDVQKMNEYKERMLNRSQ
jgi:hypothetical protein